MRYGKIFGIAALFIGATNYDMFGDDDRNKVLVFTATWCGPCKTAKEEITSFVTEKSDELSLRKSDINYVDIDNKPNLATKYGITLIPSIVILDKDDKVLEKRIPYLDVTQTKEDRKKMFVKYFKK